MSLLAAMVTFGLKWCTVFSGGLPTFAPFAFAFGIGLTFFEFMVQCLQAYIFTLLTALYIAGALADEH